MSLNPRREEDRKKLDDATKRSYDDGKKYRDVRKTFLGAYLPDKLNFERVAGEEVQNIIPLLFQAVETDVYDLCAQNPRVTCETEFSHLKSFARRRGLMLNKRIAEIDFENVLRAAVYDAEFMAGVLEVHNGESHALDFGEYGTVDPGLPTICHVPYDDYFWDTSARHYQQRRFEGKFFRADLGALLRDPNIEQRVKDQLPKAFTAGDERDANRWGSQAQGEGANADLLEPAVDLKTVYLCHERLIVTMVVDRPDLPPLRVTEWDDDQGPFHLLQLGYTPDQVIGVCPAALGYVLHNLENMIWKKRRDQAATQKNVVAYQGAAKEDAQRLMDAENNSYIHMAHIDLIKMFSTMGPDQAVGQFAMEAMNQFDRTMGNLPARAGLGPSTDTVGQDQMILGSVSRMQAKKANSVLSYAAKLLHCLGKLLDRDKFYSRDLFHETPNGAARIAYPWRPEHREGEPDQFTLRIEPYSLMYVNPSAKFKGVVDFITGVIMPAFPLGQMLDISELVNMGAEYLDEPRLRDIIKPQAMVPSDPNNFANDMGVLDVDVPKAGKPNGEYTRRNVRAPGSGDYADKQVQAAMLGGKPQMNGSLPTGVKQL